MIRQALKDAYLQPTRPPFARLVHEVQVRCLQEGLQPPNRRTVKQCLLETDLRTRARRCGDATVPKATQATPGSYKAARPLEVVQIDPKKVDVIVVAEETGEPRGRLWLTLAMDAPSRLSISLCLLHAVYDKAAWLQGRDVEAAWPIAGLPEALHAENGAHFRSHAFVRACRGEGIKTIWRKPGTPRYGGHIERLIGTQMGAVRLLPIRSALMSPLPGLVCRRSSALACRWTTSPLSKTRATCAASPTWPRCPALPAPSASRPASSAAAPCTRKPDTTCPRQALM